MRSLFRLLELPFWWLSLPFRRWERKTVALCHLRMKTDIPIPVSLIINEMLVKYSPHIPVQYSVRPSVQPGRETWSFRVSNLTVMVNCFKELTTDDDY